ncbi:MAG TPA: helix-turn-helix transcriptional regulator [Microbacteriaceae bacterium]|nr:helix-turn-helix transcriptional regulator [Microbacteriaceae bacterium]
MVGEGSEAFRAGEQGYWAHWWEARTERDPALLAAGEPFRMELIVDGTFAERDWLAEFDRDIVGTVVGEGHLTGRVIVPPGALERPAEDLVALALSLGFEIRVLAVETTFAIYDRTVAIVPERNAAGEIGHRRIERPSVVAPLRELFELHWAAATSWGEYARGATDVLDLLARGWSDARISAELGVSMRTVSRRVAEAMTAAGARTRFELGMRYERSRRGDLA